ncbi:MAG: carboxymuconolactone decarboxylase family protein [Candidatus Acidiferrales bacterium]
MKSFITLLVGIAMGAMLAWALAIPKVRARAAENEARFSQLAMGQLNDQQRPLGEQIMKVSSIGLGGPYNLMLRSPVMGERLFRMLDYLRFNTSVPRRLNELAILIQARLWTSQVEWRAHYPLALKAGLSQAVADELAQGKRPTSMKPDEAVVYDLCMELSTRRELSDATFQRARAIFSDQQIVDLVALSGTYVTAAMLMKAAADEGTPNGKVALLRPLPAR